MSAGHTEGPWIDGNEAIKVMADRQKPWNGTVFQAGVEDKALALVALTFGETVEECVSIARLIAAAPELLAALEKIERALGGASNGTLEVAAAACARAAIAKAKGELS